MTIPEEESRTFRGLHYYLRQNEIPRQIYWRCDSGCWGRFMRPFNPRDGDMVHSLCGQRIGYYRRFCGIFSLPDCCHRTAYSLSDSRGSMGASSFGILRHSNMLPDFWHRGSNSGVRKIKLRYYHKLYNEHRSKPRRVTHLNNPA